MHDRRRMIQRHCARFTRALSGAPKPKAIQYAIASTRGGDGVTPGRYASADRRRCPLSRLVAVTVGFVIGSRGFGLVADHREVLI